MSSCRSAQMKLMQLQMCYEDTFFAMAERSGAPRAVVSACWGSPLRARVSWLHGARGVSQLSCTTHGSRLDQKPRAVRGAAELPCPAESEAWVLGGWLRE